MACSRRFSSLPTQALSALSPRAGGLSFSEAAAFSLDPHLLPRALLPTYGLDDRLLSEYVAWIGFLGMALALVGLWPAPAVRHERARRFGLLGAGMGLFLALGGYNPFFWPLWRLVPGFDLFRAPARWLLLWAFGSALLAGVGVERWRQVAPDLRRPALLPGVVALGGLGLAIVLADWPAARVLPLWGAMAVAVGAMLLVPRLRVPGPLLLLLLVGEFWLAALGLDSQKATAPEAYSGLRPVPAHLLTQPSGRLLSLSDLDLGPRRLAVLQARHAGLLGEEAIYDLVVATKLKRCWPPTSRCAGGWLPPMATAAACSPRRAGWPSSAPSRSPKSCPTGACGSN